MENPEVAQVFEEVADLLEIQSANPFRVRAYRNAARTIRDLSESLAETAGGDAADKLDELPGIGKDLAGKIQTILQTHDLPLRQELRSQVPTGLRTPFELARARPQTSEDTVRPIGCQLLG